MRNQSFQFSERQAKEMAIFISELIRQGVTYEIENGIDVWTITLTGGY